MGQIKILITVALNKVFLSVVDIQDFGAKKISLLFLNLVRIVQTSYVRRDQQVECAD